jgi:hypothetical protein
MRPAEVVVTSRRPTLTSEWLNPMPRHASKSSKVHAKPSRAAEWEKAVRDGDREKIEALGRRGPGETPEKDTYVQIDDLVEGAPITGPAAAARPPLTEIPELIGMMLKGIERHGGVPDLPKKVVADWFKGQTLSNGRVIEQHLADAMATCCRSAIGMRGGNRWQG